MAGIASGASEVILLCVSDYLTNEVLIHAYVCPTEQITQMRTEIHGIPYSKLNEAIVSGQALNGWLAARHELWKYIDENTILIGHALHNDLDALRVIHHRIVDSTIVSKKKIGVPGTFGFGLSDLCEELLGVEMRKGKGGVHECLEDVMATREIVLVLVGSMGEARLDRWVQMVRTRVLEAERVRKQKREEKREEASAKKEEGAGRQQRGAYDSALRVR